jgi:NADPH-dependent glutamate synthase beta subunit-like oxidoreductase
MLNQLFKKKIPSEILVALLESICIKTEKYYLVNHDVYKKGIFTNKIPEFMSSIREYYYLSKQKYVDKKLSYNSFTTVLRQICKHNHLTFGSQIKYDKSNYDIHYYVYFTGISQ